MALKRKAERAVSKKSFGRLGLPKPIREISQHARFVRTSKGNRIMVMPGVKPEEIRALYPSNWKHKLHHYGTRTRRGQGQVFTAETADSKGKKFKIQCRTIRPRYTSTHEARMLSLLQKKEFRVEQPLAVVFTPEGERILVTKYLRRKVTGNFEDVKKAERRLRKMKIVPEDLYEYGRQNYAFVMEKDKPVLYLIDVEHYYSKDKKSRLYGPRMAKR